MRLSSPILKRIRVWPTESCVLESSIYEVSEHAVVQQYHPKSWWLIFFLSSLIMIRALPGNTTQDAAGNDVFVEGYDIVTVIAVPPNNASAITVVIKRKY